MKDWENFKTLFNASLQLLKWMNQTQTLILTEVVVMIKLVKLIKLFKIIQQL